MTFDEFKRDIKSSHKIEEGWNYLTIKIRLNNYQALGVSIYHKGNDFTAYIEDINHKGLKTKDYMEGDKKDTLDEFLKKIYKKHLIKEN